MINRLKSIELQGIKTFATLTRLEFPGQITAIVGPNGSGKSNIADSVRWVLGEQSYSLLRAKRTEDMIFSGSQQRSRSGMAVATITFDNADGWLPIDFSTVSISRRAYRDSQNEYLLNGQKVRLKDIFELLSQTGLSERTYTIIGQGLVDVALALRPDERRKLFEEAAGIGLYRSRKEESLRRLETTGKNLERILDIMTEIKPRLRSLEKQVERFSDYEQKKADLRELLNEWYGYQWHRQQRQLLNLRSAVHEQENCLNELTQKQTETENQIDEARQKLQINRKTLEALHGETSDMHQRLQQITRQLAIIEERKRSNIHQKGNLEIDIANLQEEFKELNTQKERFHEDIQQRMEEFQAAELEVDQVESQLAEISTQREEIEKNLLISRQDRVATETNKVQILARIDELEKRIGFITQDSGKINSTIEEVQQNIHFKKEQIDRTEISAKQLKTAQADIQDQLDENIKLHEEIQSKIRVIDRNYSNLDAQEAKLQAQIDVLKQAEEALTGYSEGMKKLVEGSRRGRLPTGIEPLSQHIKVDEKFEKAISAALGELTDLVIVPSQGTEVVIEYLTGKENDRVALVSLDSVQPFRSGIRKFTDGGVFGFANDLIQADSAYQELVDKLFSDIVVVKDHKTVHSIQPQLHPNEKVVTLDGIVFQANGVIISGVTPAGKRIGRTRRKGELVEDLNEISTQKVKVENEQVALLNSLKEVDIEQNDIREKLTIKEQEKSQALEKLKQAEDELFRFKQHQKWLIDQANDVQLESQRTQEEIDTAKQQLKVLDQKIQSLQAEEKLFSAKLEELPVFDLQKTLNQLQTHCLLTQNALETSQQRNQDLNLRINNTQERMSIFNTRLSDLESRLIDLASQESVLKAEGDKLSEQIDRLNSEKIIPLSTSGKDLENSISALESLAEQSHQEIITAERQYTQLQLELNREEDQISLLRERIKDDFSLTSTHYEQKDEGSVEFPLQDNEVEALPEVLEISESIGGKIRKIKNQIRRMGAINPDSQKEYFEVKERHDFLTEQVKDLEKASRDLNELIKELDDLMALDFLKTFKSVNQAFSMYFARLFNGGEAKLLVSDKDDPVEGGIDIEARLPGRRNQGLALLSGGERSLTAVALIFALLKVSPTPFCILDEVDAMLDESNVGRFIELLRELSGHTQFVIITHNRNTVQAADVIYGVTMGRDSTSQMISLKLEDVDEKYLE